VQKARRAFLDQPLLTSRGISDRNLFDGDLSTVLALFGSKTDPRIAEGCLRVDFAETIEFDVVKVHTQAEDRTLQQNLIYGAQFSKDLIAWAPAEEVIQHGSTLHVYPADGGWRYFRMRLAPERVSEVEAHKDGNLLERGFWRASNLFAHPDAMPPVAAWSANVKVDEVTPTSYLCVAVDGEHGVEGCYAALRRKGKPLGFPERAPSFPVNPWEYPVRKFATGYTYFFPLDQAMVGEEFEVFLLGMKGGGLNLKPSVWITARDLPFTAKRLEIGP
jgi:hypothetical protein